MYQGSAEMWEHPRGQDVKSSAGWAAWVINYSTLMTMLPALLALYFSTGGRQGRAEPYHHMAANERPTSKQEKPEGPN